MEIKTINYLIGYRCGHPMETTLYNGAGTNADTLPYNACEFVPFFFLGRNVYTKNQVTIRVE